MDAARAKVFQEEPVVVVIPDLAKAADPVVEKAAVEVRVREDSFIKYSLKFIS
jgi:hypothetical protein